MSTQSKRRRKEERKAQVYERRSRDDGVEIVDGGDILDAPDEVLVQVYLAGKEKFGAHGRKGHQSMIAAELVRRGALRGCGCADCTAIRADALAWEAHCKTLGVDPRTCESPLN